MHHLFSDSDVRKTYNISLNLAWQIWCFILFSYSYGKYHLNYLTDYYCTIKFKWSDNGKYTEVILSSLKTGHDFCHGCEIISGQRPGIEAICPCN